MAARAKDKVHKSQMIRQVIQNHKNWDNKEIADQVNQNLKGTGQTVTDAYVGTVRSKMKQSRVVKKRKNTDVKISEDALEKGKDLFRSLDGDWQKLEKLFDVLKVIELSKRE